MFICEVLNKPIWFSQRALREAPSKAVFSVLRVKSVIPAIPEINEKEEMTIMKIHHARGSEQPPAHPTETSQQQLHDMVDSLRERLHAIGDQGDCAYERAMGIKYQELLHELEARIDNPPEWA